MSGRGRHAHDSLCRTTITEITGRLDDLRSLVERRPLSLRIEDERELDHLRGLRNRAMARVEGARLAPDDGWAAARRHADDAIRTLTDGVDDLERRIARAAA